MREGRAWSLVRLLSDLGHVGLWYSDTGEEFCIASYCFEQSR